MNFNQLIHSCARRSLLFTFVSFSVLYCMLLLVVVVVVDGLFRLYFTCLFSIALVKHNEWSYI